MRAKSTNVQPGLSLPSRPDQRLIFAAAVQLVPTCCSVSATSDATRECVHRLNGIFRTFGAASNNKLRTTLSQLTTWRLFGKSSCERRSHLKHSEMFGAPNRNYSETTGPSGCIYHWAQWFCCCAIGRTATSWTTVRPVKSSTRPGGVTSCRKTAASIFGAYTF